MKRFSLSRKEIIRRKKDFELVYSSGKTILSRNLKLKAVYFTEKKSERCGVKTAFAVYSKAGKAVWRNRVKRLLKESYRLNKEVLIDKCREEKTFLLLVFSLNNINQKNYGKIYLEDIMPEVIDLMNQIKVSI